MINFLYFLIVIGLGISVYAQWWLYPIPTPIVTTTNPIQTATDDANAAQLIPHIKSLRSKRSYSRIAQRPLFSATRRPAVVEEEEEVVTAPVEEPKPPIEEQRLDGLMLTAIIVRGEEHIALMKDPQIDKTLRLKKGESIRGWNVTNVGADTISLLSPNGTSSDLNLRIFRPPIAAAAPVPPQPIPPPEAINAPPGEMPPGNLPPQFNRRRRSRRPPNL